MSQCLEWQQPHGEPLCHLHRKLFNQLPGCFVIWGGDSAFGVYYCPPPPQPQFILDKFQQATTAYVIFIDFNI